MMEIQILTSIKELESIRERWNALLSQSVDDVVHLKYEWFISVITSYSIHYTKLYEGAFGYRQKPSQQGTSQAPKPSQSSAPRQAAVQVR